MLPQVSKVPWKSILTSRPALSLVIVHCGQNFGHWLLLTEMPNYMKNVLGFNIKGMPEQYRKNTEVLKMASVVNASRGASSNTPVFNEKLILYLFVFIF